MKTRLVSSTIIAMCLAAVAACGGSDLSIPSAPTPSTPQPAPSPPPPPPLAVDLTGSYALTFEVGSACEQVPKELRIRTYEARIRYVSSFESTDSFLAELSGATFHDQSPVWIEVTHGESGSTVWLDLAVSDNVILEEPEPGTHFMIAGADGMAAVKPTDLSAISAVFTGHFNYCAASSAIDFQKQCSADAMMRSLCKSADSRWTLRLR
jgi:hypothetical protein